VTNKKISELNAASTLAGTEVLPVVQSSATVKATVNQVLANLSASNLTSGTVPLARLSGITASQIANAHHHGDTDRQCDHHGDTDRQCDHH
jgi:hypothetical protein